MNEGAQEPMNANIGVNEAADKIMAVMQDVAVMGANDSELPTLNRIVERLKKGEITPEEALEQAFKIQDSKAAYH